MPVLGIIAGRAPAAGNYVSKPFRHNTLFLLVLPIIGKYKNNFLFLFEKDKFAMANIQAEVYWSGWEIVVGLIFPNLTNKPNQIMKKGY